MTEVEKLAQNRTQIIYAMAITFALWQGGDIATQMIATDNSWFLFAGLMKIVGAIAYAVSALCFFIFYRRVKKANAAMTLRDDWNRFTRGLALQYGFFILIGATTVMYAISMFWTLPTMPILQAIITVGVTGTLMAFVMLQDEGEQ